MVLICDFRGYEPPEITKARPVVVISTHALRRQGLVTVVPLSTTAPDPTMPCHLLLSATELPGIERSLWVKGDLVAAVSIRRLDRVHLGRGRYGVGQVSVDTIRRIRRCVLFGLGIDPASLDP